jgi:hypothetical protein
MSRTTEGRAASRQAVVINQSLARVLFGGDYPIGRWFKVSPEAPMQTVIGVVQDAKQTSPVTAASA